MIFLHINISGMKGIDVVHMNQRWLLWETRKHQEKKYGMFLFFILKYGTLFNGVC